MLGRSFGLNEAELLNVERGAMLHDIGKMAIPDSILLKPGPLSDEEWTVMRRHPQFALEMLQSISFLENSLDIPYCHHEKWDGTGYPHGLREEEIPFAARMFAIADVWDALSSDRPYRPAWPISKVREHCKSLSGTHFDPQIVEMLLELTQVDEPETPLKLAA
jgi:HD-GYP domain-containing protein (c-di-GMP phosphodiesterase class II)